MNIKNNLKTIIEEKQTTAFPFRPSHTWYKEIGISKQRFGEILRNEKQPTLDELAKLSAFFEAEVSELYSVIK
jgi:hypothetical protein